MNNSMRKNLTDTFGLLDFIAYHYDSPLIYVAYSGGSDSAVVLDIAAKWSRLRNIDIKAMSIDTGLACDGWRDMVTRHCDAAGVSVDFCTGKGSDWYIENVGEYGFGYTPSAHTYYYRALKQDAIQAHVQSVKRHYHDRVVYLTGVRRAESRKRANAKWFIRHGARVTVNAIAGWGNIAKTNYLSIVAKWWSNPFYEVVGNSGDCQCGWVCKNSLADLSPYPNLHEIIRVAQNKSLERGLNHYGERLDSVDNGTSTMPDDSLCVNCHQPRLL
jgi:3'-phosphoadenosine 5'-phosphosulfate sulfotransferase (PAPS reductase)/FAD synthetase